MNKKSLLLCALIALTVSPAFGKGSGTNAVVFAAAAAGNIVKLKEYFVANPKLLSLRNDLLRAAALNGRTAAVEYLISQGADVNARGFEEMTPLAQIALSWGPHRMRDPEYDKKCAEEASILIAHGAMVDPVDAYGVTPLLHAVESEKSRMTRVLLEHGADTRKRYLGVNRGMTPLHMAVMDRDKDTVAALLQFKAPVDAVDRHGATPLLLAEERNESQIAAMLREADPGAARDVPHFSVPPTRSEMRTLARRIADGDEAALDELESTADKLYGEIKDFRSEHARIMMLLFTMTAAFDVLGKDAGKGNDQALQALEKCLTRKGRLRSFAPDALGIAAAGGNTNALEVLIHYRRWDILESTARFALCAPTAANMGPAVDLSADWLLRLPPDERNGGMVMATTNALGKAAAKGNLKAKAALKEFAALQAADPPAPAVPLKQVR